MDAVAAGRLLHRRRRMFDSTSLSMASVDDSTSIGRTRRNIFYAANNRITNDPFRPETTGQDWRVSNDQRWLRRQDIVFANHSVSGRRHVMRRQPGRSNASAPKQNSYASPNDHSDILDNPNKWSAQQLGGSALREQNEELQAQLEKLQADHDSLQQVLKDREIELERSKRERSEEQHQHHAKFQNLDSQAYNRARHDISRELKETMADTQRNLEHAREYEGQLGAKIKALERAKAEMTEQRQTEKYENAKYLADEKERLEQLSKKEMQERWDRLEKASDIKFSEELSELRRAGEARRHERGSYQQYKSVWRQLDFDARDLQGRMGSLKKLLDLQHGLWDETKRRFNPEKIETWFPQRYPKITKEIRDMLSNKQRGVEQSAKSLSAIIAELDEVDQEVERSGHYSRVLTRYHRFNEDYSGIESLSLLKEMLDERPLVEHRNRLDTNLQCIEVQLKSAMPSRKREQLLHYRRALRDEREVIVAWLTSNVNFRDAETFDSLLQSSSEVQEVFARLMLLRDHLFEADRAWFGYYRSRTTGALKDADERVQAGQRTAYLQAQASLKDDLQGYEHSIRKRQLLQDSLGHSLSQKDKERFAQTLRERKTILRSTAQEKLRQVAKLGSVRASLAVSPSLRSTKSALPKPSRPRVHVATQRRELVRKLRRSTVAETKVRLERKLNEIDNRDQSQDRQQPQPGSASPKKRPGGEKTRNATQAREDARDDVSAGETTNTSGDKSAAKVAGSSPKTDRESKSISHRVSARKFRVRKYSSSSRRNLQTSGNSPNTAKEDGRLNLTPTASRQAPHPFWPTIALQSDDMCTTKISEKGAGVYGIGAALHFGGHEAFGNALTQHTANEATHDRSVRLASNVGSPMENESQGRHEKCTVHQAGLPDASQSSLTSASDQSSYQPSQGSDAAAPASPESSSQGQSLVGATEQLSHLKYHMSKDAHRKAVVASPNTAAAYWTYRLYKNSDGAVPPAYYCTNLDQAEIRAKEFLSEPVIGFDIEWEIGHTPAKSGAKKNVSLIQIAADDKIALFHVAMFKGDTIDNLMPASLREILESRDVIKAGVNIQGDASRLNDCLNVKMTGIFELSHLYRVVMFSNTPGQINRKPFKLADQVENVLLLPLKKDAVRTSAWSKKLDLQQCDYAASDAYAGFRLFHALEAKRKMMDPVPPRPAFWEEHKPIQLGDGTLVQAKSRKKAAGVGGKKAVENEDDDEDEDFFDAVENQDAYNFESGSVESAGVPLAGLSITYPTLPPTEDQLETSLSNLTISGPPNSSTDSDKPQPTPKRPGPPESEPITQAESWVSTYRASLPAEYALKAKHAQLRAYALWHAQRLDCKDVAALLREPPLALQTVATYVLEAITSERLEYDVQRGREVLGILPASVRGRYGRIAEEIGKDGG